MSNEIVLVTGAAGYIGSHACLELLEQGYEVVALDNLVNGKIETIQRVEKITGKEIPFSQIDLRDRKSLKKLFSTEKIDSIIHFAGYKAVGESVENPLLYYSNNVAGSINLLSLMKDYGIDSIVFSSSCTVYGNPACVPVDETAERMPTNPYGRSKLIVEQILEDFYKASKRLSVSILRYFNPIGAHPSGIIGEDPTGIPNNLVPYISKVAAGKLDDLKVFGDDYNTKDGTGVRDYIHVVDLVKAHIKALEELRSSDKIFRIYNLGTGEGYSVLEVIKAFQEVSGVKIPYTITSRRCGDVDKTYADVRKANRMLNWVAQKSLEEMCKDMWNWQCKNPNGYQ